MVAETKQEQGYKRVTHRPQPEESKPAQQVILEELEQIYTLLKVPPKNDLTKYIQRFKR